jgi:DNA-binding LacI/PurR family transcriptional regulator
VVDGRRRIFHEDNRLRLADGCVLLGRSLDRDELARLVAEGQPFVSVGRRADAGGPVPYVGADYPGATAAVVRRALAAGHTALAYLGQGAGPESHADRMAGFRAALDTAGLPVRHEPTAERSPADLLDALLDARVTAAVVEEYADGVAIAALARERGLAVPEELSILALGDPTRPAATDLDLTGFRIPRREMGWQAVEVLTGLLAEDPGLVSQRILPCQPVDGSTLAPPAQTTK